MITAKTSPAGTLREVRTRLRSLSRSSGIDEHVSVESSWIVRTMLGMVAGSGCFEVSGGNHRARKDFET